jgi:hypothetical protein
MPSSIVQYRMIRFSHNSLSQCQISDFVFEGIIFSTFTVANGVSKQCDLVISAPNSNIVIPSAITYSHSSTAVITNISPRFASA